MRLLLSALLLLCLAHRVVAELGPNDDPGIYDEKNKPVLELPYGRFEAFSKRDGLWTFKNIPYAAPPVDNLRWAKPEPPHNYTELQRGEAGGTLPYQVWMNRLRVVEHNNNHYDEFGNEKGLFNLEGIGHSLGANEEYENSDVYGEDCLTLDIVVPESALVNPLETSLPIVVFIYGGAFIAGGKETTVPFLPLYDGYGLVNASGGKMIYVVFNYRVGAFGFLGGTTMEREAVPNVGLWDQRAAFQWVQDHIKLVGGDAAQVTAVGHSAGASSILFHLTAEGGTLDPLFKYAIIMSPAYIPMWDREGEVEARFQKFASLAGCDGLGLECLRTRSSEQLQKANQELSLREASSTYSFGPVPDGSYIRQLPMLEWAQGNVWPIKKVILTHTSQETVQAINTDISQQGWSYNYLASLLPQRDLEAGWIDKILDTYPYWNPMEAKWSHLESRFQSELHRMQNIVLHSCFTCHMRWLIQALGEERVHLQYYSVWPFFHGADLMPLFWNEEVRADDFGQWVGTLVRQILDMLGRQPKFVEKYRQFFINFVTHQGEPSVVDDQVVPAEDPVSSEDARVFWQHPILDLPEKNQTHQVGNVLAVALKEPHAWDRPFANVEIGTMPRGKCDFWMDFYSQMSESGNYSVPI